MLLLYSALEQGMLYSLVSLGVYLSSRILRFDDLSLEASFGLGGALCVFLLSCNAHPLIAFFLGTLGGMCGGGITIFLHLFLKVNNLVAGLIVTTALYSVHLFLAGAVSIISGHTIFSLLPSFISPLFVFSFFALSSTCAALLFLDTEVGYFVRAVGSNPSFVLYNGKSIYFFKTLGVLLAHACASLAGVLFVQHTGYFSLTGQIGTLIIGLTGLMLSEKYMKYHWGFIFVGPILYQLLLAAALASGLPPSWNKLLVACMLVIILSYQRFFSSHRQEYA